MIWTVCKFILYCVSTPRLKGFLLFNDAVSYQDYVAPMLDNEIKVWSSVVFKKPRKFCG